MLSEVGTESASGDDALFDGLRTREFARLDRQDLAYLDYTGSALYGASQLEAYAAWLAENVCGNPHSEHAPSRESTRVLDAARRATLAFLDADPGVYAVCFTANTSAALKLVGESYGFSPARGLLLSADNHNSVNGLREFARAARAPVSVLPLDASLRLEEPAARLQIFARESAGLFALPYQSNFSGVKHPLLLIAAARDLGFDTLIDAASAGPASGLSLREHAADFVALSFYKLFGLPTGLGALVVRRDALARLERPWFSGGTVDFVSVRHDRHRLSPGHTGFEDGTQDFLGAAAVTTGFDFLRTVGKARLRARIEALTAEFLARVGVLTHRDGSPLVRIYGPSVGRERGAAVALNLLQRDGAVMPYPAIEARARDLNVAVRGGCFCNPGAAEQAFGFDDEATGRCFDTLGETFSVPRFAACLGADATVGAVRFSFGLPTNGRDLDRAVDLIASLAETPAGA